jgi:hypothetical protein
MSALDGDPAGEPPNLVGNRRDQLRASAAFGPEAAAEAEFVADTRWDRQVPLREGRGACFEADQQSIPARTSGRYGARRTAVNLVRGPGRAQLGEDDAERDVGRSAQGRRGRRGLQKCWEGHRYRLAGPDVSKALHTEMPLHPVSTRYSPSTDPGHTSAPTPSAGGRPAARKFEQLWHPESSHHEPGGPESASVIPDISAITDTKTARLPRPQRHASGKAPASREPAEPRQDRHRHLVRRRGTPRFTRRGESASPEW